MVSGSSTSLSATSDSTILLAEESIDHPDNFGHQVGVWASAGCVDDARIRLNELTATESLDCGAGRSRMAFCPSKNIDAKDAVDLPEGCNRADMVDMIENREAVEGARLCLYCLASVGGCMCGNGYSE